MNQYALFLGCNIPVRVKQYDVSARMVLKELGVSLVDIRQFNCCGYPMRNTDPKAFLLSAVRNLALAEKANLDMLVLCQCCYGSLKKAQAVMVEEGELQEEVRLLLAEEGLEYNGNVKIKHFLSVLLKIVFRVFSFFLRGAKQTVPFLKGIGSIQKLKKAALL